MKVVESRSMEQHKEYAKSNNTVGGSQLGSVALETDHPVWGTSDLSNETNGMEPLV